MMTAVEKNTVVKTLEKSLIFKIGAALTISCNLGSIIQLFDFR